MDASSSLNSFHLFYLIFFKVLLFVCVYLLGWFWSESLIKMQVRGSDCIHYARKTCKILQDWCVINMEIRMNWKCFLPPSKGLLYVVKEGLSY